MKPFLIACLLALAVAPVKTSFAAEAPPLRERFADPPARFRILKIVHRLPATEVEQDALLANLATQGFGGLVTNVPFKNYLRDEASWQVFARTVGEARRRGMAMWLYDEAGYPSGTAGGLTLQDHPEWQARGLLIADTVTTGAALALALPPGRLLCAAAYPAGEAIDLDKAVDLARCVKDGKLTWRVPGGRWRVLAITEDALYEGTHAAIALAERRPYINMLQAAPTDRFIQLTHQAYADHLGGDLGKYFIATFTDEPSLMSVFLAPQPWRVLPWSQDFAREFRARRGYELGPLLPALVTEAGPRTARTRHDFWLTVSELTAENFFGRIRDWCRAHGVPSGGHLLAEEPLMAHVPFYGDFFRCARALDAPSIDCLTSIPSQVPWFIARLLASAGELDGHPDNMSETSDHSQRYRPAGDTRPVVPVSEAQIRGTCNRQIVNGITGITSYYSFNGLDDAALRRLNTWIGRCTAMLYGGSQVTDIAVVYPIQSVWPRFEPSRDKQGQLPQATWRIERAYRAAADQLFFNQRDFTFIDARTLEEGKVDGGALRHRGLAWRVIILPGVDTLPLKAWENLKRFQDGGGAVVALGARPANSEREFPSPEVQKIGREMFDAQGKSPRGPGVFLPYDEDAKLTGVLDKLAAPQIRGETLAGSPLRLTHRRFDGYDIFFVINDGDKPWAGQIALAAAGNGERLDPASGAITPVNNAGGIKLALEPYGGVLFRFNDRPQP